MEHRYLTTEVRLGGSGKMLYGRAASFNKRSTDKSLGFVEQVARGAFRKSLQSRADVKCLMNHDPSLLLGRTSSGTLRCAESEDGLDFECDLPDTTAGRDVRELCTRGDLNECSFGFVCDEDSWDDDVDDEGRYCALRTLRSVSLLDVSVVTNPAYGGSTKANVRSLFVGSIPERLAVECRSRGIAIPTFQQVVKVAEVSADARRSEVARQFNSKLL